VIIDIENIFSSIENYNCFACGPSHPFGLRLRFKFDTESNEIFTQLRPDRLFAGFPEILHGGIQATILDEVAFWGAWARFKRSGFTFDMKLRYRKKCPIETTLEARGIVGDISHKMTPVSVCLMGVERREIFTEGEIRYYLPDEDPRAPANR
jgi:hypothetical protein